MSLKNIFTTFTLALMVSGPTTAAILTGTIATEQGQPAVGAMFTVWNEAQDRKETVYTDAAGSFAIKTDFGGELRFRARLVNFEDAVEKVSVGVDEPKAVDLVVKQFSSPAARSDALTASAHAAILPWKDQAQRTPFISQCNYCHQNGNALTRVPRDAHAWLASVERMEGYFALISAAEKADIVEVLHKGFDGKPVDAVQDYGANPELANAKVSQWLVGDAMSFIHDTDIGHDDKLYGTDEGRDIIWVLDRKTHQTEQIPLPDWGLPRGGKFAGMTMPIGIFTGHHGPHSSAEGQDGRMWFSASLSSSLIELDTRTNQLQMHRIPGDTLYPHTVRMGLDQTVWFTINASNQIAQFDPKTATFKIRSLPHNGFWRWLSDMLMPTIMHVASWLPEKNLPLTISHHRFFGRVVVGSAYGIDVNPLDGSLWVAQLYDNRIVRVDAQTWEMKSYPTPYSGPRRPRFDKSGSLWIPAFDDGMLMRFDPKTETFENFTMPLLAANENEVPYALNVHPDTQDIWIATNASDRILRFIPKTGQFLSYPSPTRVTVLRDLVFSKDGGVCQATSNLPAYGMEDRLPAFTCFYPEGGAQDRALIAATTVL